MSDLRTRDEIQRAHDTLVGILLDPEVRAYFQEELLSGMISAADVFCWMLRHENNQRFAMGLEVIEEIIAKHGHVIALYQNQKITCKSEK